MVPGVVSGAVHERFFSRAVTTPRFPLMALPPEMVLEIFFDFTAEDALACGLTCKQLNQITASEPLWKWLYARDFHKQYPLSSTPVSFYTAYREAYVLRKREREAWCGCWGYMSF